MQNPLANGSFSRPTRPKILTRILAAALLCSGALAGCAAAPGDDLENSTTALIEPADCSNKAVDGKVGLCHATGSASNPYIHLRVSVKACLNGHLGHEGDFVSDDPACPISTCTPAVCPNLGCGTMPDGCGGTLNCGDCSSLGYGWLCAETTCLPS